MNSSISIKTLAAQARFAAQQLALCDTASKNAALHAMAEMLLAQQELILQANAKDLQAAKKNAIAPALLDRLSLSPQRIAAMAQGMRDVAALPDPINTVLNDFTRPNGLQIRKIRVPIGVIAMIYEARPNVTADVAALCLKSGNAVILRGGSEALNSNIAILQALTMALKNTSIPASIIQLMTDTSHQAVKELVQLTDNIDLVIPRGGENLINMIMENARVPVIKHYKGVCHTYVDASADLEMALAICENAKCQRPGVCNAMESLLLHEKIAAKFLPAFAKRVEKYHLELRGDEAARAIVPTMQAASEADWSAEYLDFILAVKVVPNLAAAIQHINHYGSHHSDAIIAADSVTQNIFLQAVDSAVVYVNASTRFTDGAEFGMGAEIGISTEKLHARGPMGLEELTTYKYCVLGTGQIRP
jgi:glutamate-5-semialdehyde dehydrogenase